MEFELYTNVRLKSDIQGFPAGTTGIIIDSYKGGFLYEVEILQESAEVIMVSNDDLESVSK